MCLAIFSIINDSLRTGVVSAALKTAAVTKKNNIYLENLNN